ncbi:hypothetical protein [Pantoea cypripedii]|uniref:Uncharacterized protein n=1 Tax=Pantoea cypripedii TaxID=55209 RepID=A0A6B9GFM6_PANCY|nr:hypothetical protein [Pantoea cypripedii]QGY32519.1 hypothetical protein CUN67_26525 [Pantoea cypripedii]
MKKTNPAKKNRKYSKPINLNQGVFSSDAIIVSLTPVKLTIGDGFEEKEIKQVVPGGALTWYANGPPGGTLTINLERVPDSGGHFHGSNTNDPLVVGAISPTTIVLPSSYPQNVPATYTASETCGSVRLIVRTAKPSVIEHLIEIMIQGLQPIQSSSCLKLKTPTAAHPSPYWATQTMIEKLNHCAAAYNQATNKPLTITDASLQWGGRFDLNQDWGPPHKEHRNGNQADIRSNDMTADDKQKFLKAATDAGLTVLDESNHWHVRG